eukprot:m.187875 g.187875  ORF g.187875 m.187875 type:complete len:178 (-) comp32319_c0_seq3:3495-4028(-)
MAESQVVIDGMEFTGSSYEGQTKNGRLEGVGKYTFPNGTWYEGGMNDGEFHGHGKLFFPNGNVFEAEWSHGISKGDGMARGTLTFKDGLVFAEKDWDYCTHDDRRFYSERIDGIKPAGRSQLTDKGPLEVIPGGCYDVGDGYLDPTRNEILSYDHVQLRKPNKEEIEWAKKYCRVGK